MNIAEFQKMYAIIGSSIPMSFRVVPKQSGMNLEIKLESPDYFLSWTAVTAARGDVKRYKSYNAILYDICRIKSGDEQEIETVTMDVKFRKIL